MTPDEFRDAGEALFGPRWQSALARALGRQHSEVHRWLTGERAVPATVARLIRLLLFVHRAGRLEKALAAIDAQD